MTDLKELSQFEKDLKNLIDSRSNFKPYYMNINDHAKPIEWSEQEKKRLHEMGKLGMFMGIPEHGRPHSRLYIPENVVSFMAVGEHGQPYKSSK
jgi:hypothetical protein